MTPGLRDNAVMYATTRRRSFAGSNASMKAAATLLAAAVLAFAGCARADDRDPEVYAAALAAVSGGASPPPAIVVRDRTATVGEMLKGSRAPAAEMRQRMPEASERLVAALIEAAKEPRALTQADLSRADKVKAEVVPAERVAHAFEGVPMAEAWRRLAEKHGGARSVVTLSPVAYDDATHSALVYLGVACGGLCGGGSLLRLEETGGRWRVAQTRPLWSG
jgi:hypothetical protein